MIRASDDTLTRAKPTAPVFSYGPSITWFVGLLGSIRASMRRVECGHVARSDLMSISAEVSRDTGFDPSDATGISSWQPDLPFFMQGGFGRK